MCPKGSYISAGGLFELKKTAMGFNLQTIFEEFSAIKKPSLTFPENLGSRGLFSEWN